MKKKNVKMTLDKLALLTQRGFLDVDKRLDVVDKRLDVVDKRLDGIDKRLDVVDKRLDGIDKRLDVVENEVRLMRKNSSELFTKLDKFILLYEKQEQELLMLGSQLRRLEERVSKLESRK